MSSLTTDVLHDCGEDIIPGNAEVMNIVCACDVASFPDFLATTTPGDSVTLDGDITLAAGKKFIRVSVITDTAELKNTLVGEMGSKAYNQTLDFKAYNVGPVESEFFNKHRNGCFVVVLEQKSGDNRVIGTKKFPARFASLEDTSGTNNESAKNWTGQLVASPGHVAPFYTGAIDLTA